MPVLGARQCEHRPPLLVAAEVEPGVGGAHADPELRLLDQQGLGDELEVLDVQRGLGLAHGLELLLPAPAGDGDVGQVDGHRFDARIVLGAVDPDQVRALRNA